MASSSVDLVKVVLEAIKETPRPLGFKKKGSTFVADRGDVLQVINLQKSTSSTADTRIVTINLGIYSKTLAGRLETASSVTSVWDCHWRERLGFLGPEPMDKWWTMQSEADAHKAGQEMIGLLTERGLPLLDGLRTTEQLRVLWATGNSPGITETMRDQYLSILSGPSPGF